LVTHYKSASLQKQTKMQAIYLVKNGSATTAFELRETAIPEPKEREVRIKVEAFGLNYADVMARNGLYKDAPPMPAVLGYEVVGIVDAVGKELDTDIIGKRVVAFTRFGGYAQYAITAEQGFTVIDDLEAGKALSIATQYATAYYMAYELNNLTEGDTVLVHAGAGGVGTALIQLCKRKGCTVFATAGSDEKCEYMLGQGANYAINYSKKEYKTEIEKF